MKKALTIFALAFVAAIAYAQPDTQHNMARTNPALTDLMTRACLFPAGGWAIVNCTNSAAASSAQLNAWSSYIMQCGDDSYWATGTAASGQDADSSDGWLPAGAWLRFITTDNLRYVSVLNKNSDSDCRVIECR